MAQCYDAQEFENFSAHLARLKAELDAAEVEAQTIYPVRSYHCSRVGHPCARALTYDWVLGKPAFGLYTLGIFRRGRSGEHSLVKHLQELNAPVVARPAKNQRRVKYMTKNGATISGKLDLDWCYEKDRELPCEIKTCGAHVMAAYSNLADMTAVDAPWWTQMYPAQLQIYMFAADESLGVLIMQDAQSYEWKAIPCSLDLAYVERMIQRVEISWDVVTAWHKGNKDVELPERLNDWQPCNMCDYKALCQPGVLHPKGGVQMSDSIDDLDKLRRWWELKETAAAFNKLDTWRKKRFDKVESCLVSGEFHVMGKETKGRKSTVVPEIELTAHPSWVKIGNPGWKSTVEKVELEAKK